MDVFHFLIQEIDRVNIFRLNILPDAMLVAAVAALLMEKLNQILLLILSKLFQYDMRCVRAKILHDVANCTAFRFENHV